MDLVFSQTSTHQTIKKFKCKIRACIFKKYHYLSLIIKSKYKKTTISLAQQKVDDALKDVKIVMGE